MYRFNEPDYNEWYKMLIYKLMPNLEQATMKKEDRSQQQQQRQ